MDSFIIGKYKKSIYHSEAGYIIGLFKVKDTNDEDVIDYLDKTITFTGYFHELNEDDTYKLYGKLVNHERYGEQYQVEKYERVMPEEKDSIVEFLSSGLFKGIGEKKAEKIVACLGKDTLKIILENPENLLLVPTITKKQADLLHEKLIEYESSYKTILYLNEIGFSTKDSMIIYNKYLEKTIPTIKENIYKLMEDIDIPFKKIDPIALKNGIKKDDKRRLSAIIIYSMNEVCNLMGHSYLLNGEIYGYTIRISGIDVGINDFDEALKSLMLDSKVVNLDDKYYLKDMYEAEKAISSRFKYLSHQEDVKYKKLEEMMEHMEQYSSITYNEEQRLAIKEAFLKHALIITGGPGVGKTTIIKAITDLYQAIHKLSYQKLTEEIALLAPTGRASKRISESTGLPALTIHRFLKWNKETNKFAVNEYNRSNVKFVIIDEASMVDTYLMNNLLKGLSYDTRIVLVGDENQLPSVGPGQVLKDLIESNVINIVKLTRLYRQGKDSNIISLAYNINNDILDTSIFNTQEDLSFIPCDSNRVKENIKDLCLTYKDTNYKKIQILAPMYKGINGIDELNKMLQNIFNPKEKNLKEIMINGVIFREKDKVIQLTNMPEDNVFNGDLGIIEEIKNDKKKEVSINFDGNVVTYTPSDFGKFKHGFSISIHKSQGSEFDFVIIPVVRGYNKMLYRKLIYTATTRAKKKLYLIGEVEAFEYAIHNNIETRRTTLKDFCL